MTGQIGIDGFTFRVKPVDWPAAAFLEFQSFKNDSFFSSAAIIRR
jgi:hypothetical protein